MINIGIIGAGHIAEVMASTIKEMNEVNSYAIAARELSRAKSFADKYGFKKAYGCYEDLLNDKEVELVYIATPHSHHYEHIKMCIEHGKHILCEKAFTINEVQAAEVLELAQSKGILLTEAIWTRYMPVNNIIHRIINDGMIGEPCMLTANIGYKISHIERLRRPELAGGALLDIGIYPINFASMFFKNEIKDISGKAVLNELGVDIQEGIEITYKDGRMAILNCTTRSATDNYGMIYGTDGYLVVDNINLPQNVSVYNDKKELINIYKAPECITGYEYEVEACIDAINNGLTECPQMPHSETLLMLNWMDRLRQQWGIIYPGE